MLLETWHQLIHSGGSCHSKAYTYQDFIQIQKSTSNKQFYTTLISHLMFFVGTTGDY